MGILKRFGDIMRSNINALLDKAEDPAKMVDQMLLDLRNDLAQVKKETAGVMADEQTAKRRVDECQANIDKYTKAAQNALKSGNEADARTLIAKKQQYAEQLAALQQTYDMAHANAVKMRQMHDKLVQDIETLELRKDTVKAKVATAKAQEHMNKITSGVDTTKSMAAFDRMEEKANKRLDAANAAADLNAGTHTTSDLADKYVAGCTATVDDEIEAMKLDLGLVSPSVDEELEAMKADINSGENE
jgi:phage shock protein A